MGRVARPRVRLLMVGLLLVVMVEGRPAVVPQALRTSPDPRTRRKNMMLSSVWWRWVWWVDVVCVWWLWWPEAHEGYPMAAPLPQPRNAYAATHFQAESEHEHHYQAPAHSPTHPNTAPTTRGMTMARQRPLGWLWAAAMLILLLDLPTYSAYQPSSKTPTSTKANPKTPSTSSKGNEKPNPLATLLQVYTRGSSSSAKATRKDRQYTLLTGLPLKPYFERQTIRTQVAEGIWTFEQPQGFFNVTTPIRMTVIRLQDGRLWVHAPVAATAECMRLLDELGEVAYIVLPTTAFEHKVFVGRFAKAYPKAKVYACPGQWSWPINLPPPFRVDGTLRDNDLTMPWATEIEQALLEPPCIGIGPANEVVFFHKRSKTLVVTDLVVFIDGAAPSPVVEVADLLKASVDDPDAVPTDAPLPPDTPANRRRGWARMALQILFLGPTRFSTFKLVEKRLLVSPVIETFVYSKVPEALVEFIDRITTRWAFTSVLPAHFNAPASATPRDLQNAFAFAYQVTGKTPAKPKPGGGGGGAGSNPFAAFLGGLIAPASAATTGKPAKYPEDDMAVLSFVNDFIVKSGVANK